MPLGCVSDYRVQVMERCRGADEPGSSIPVADLTDYTDLDWHRRLNEVSTASVTLPSSCCDQIGQVATWRQELVIFRAGEPVWQGPIVDIVDCLDGVTLQAADMMAWLARRVIHDRHCYRTECGGRAETATRIAHDLAVDGFRGPLEFLDDPCGVEWTEVLAPTERRIERQYKPASAYVIDAIDKLAESHIDYATVGKRIMFMAKGHEVSRTPVLTCDHFATNVCAAENGLAAATRVYVQGDGVRGAAGGKHPYYGLLEALVEDDSIKTRRAANETARDLANAARPPVRFVDMPQGATLAADAPVEITDLVPGVIVPMILDCLCREVSEETRLAQVDVTVDETGEKVNIGALSPREAVSQAAEDL